MKFWILGFLACLFVSEVEAASCSFSWLPNAAEENVIGYKLHYGTEPGVYTVVTDVGSPAVVGGRVYATLPMCMPGTFYFVCTAYSSTEESDFTGELSWMSPTPKIISITRSE